MTDDIVETKDLHKALAHARRAVAHLEVAALYPEAAARFYEDIDRLARHELWAAYKDTI
jgi:hypothetical protein